MNVKKPRLLTGAVNYVLGGSVPDVGLLGTSQVTIAVMTPVIAATVAGSLTKAGRLSPNNAKMLITAVNKAAIALSIVVNIIPLTSIRFAFLGPFAPRMQFEMREIDKPRCIGFTIHIPIASPTKWDILFASNIENDRGKIMKTFCVVPIDWEWSDVKCNGRRPIVSRLAEMSL